MKRIILIISLFLTGLLFTQVVTAETKGTLTVIISGIKIPEGVIRLALFNSPDSYTSTDHSGSVAYQKAIGIISKDGQSVIVLNNIPYGEYAIKLYQDSDNSGKFKTNLFGVPKEGYGFSNNAPATSGAPSYDAVKFVFSKNISLQKINLQYYK